MDEYNTFEGVEDLKNYVDKDALEKYRKEALTSFKKSSDFVKNLLRGQKIKIIEVGSGNSSLLYNLEKEHILLEGIGIELAKTRHIFAEEWKQDKNFKNITNINEDFRNINFQKKYWNVFVCNSTFQYFNSDIATDLVKTAYSSLAKNGFLILDIPTYKSYEKKMKNNVYSFIKEMPITNPFKYGLYELSRKSSSTNEFINISKYFDQNGELKAEKSDRIYKWDKNKIISTLTRQNFSNIKVYGSFDKIPFDNQIHETMYITAQKI